MDIDKAVPINLENAILIINNFIKHEYNVVVPYPLSQEDYEYIRKNLNNTELHFFTLAPDIEKTQSDTENRKLTEQERDRIQYHYDIGISRPSFGEIIDNTNQTPEETAEEIISYLSRKNIN